MRRNATFCPAPARQGASVSSHLPHKGPHMATRQLVLVTDLDGTLLDDASAWPAPPRVLREQLQRLTRPGEHPLVLAMASSRTLEEIVALQRWLGWPGPCLAEDGALVAIDDDAAGHVRAALSAAGHPDPDIRIAGRRRLCVVRLGTPADQLRNLLREWPGFGAADLAHAELPRLTALGFGSPNRRRRSLTGRQASVLLDPAQWRAIVRTAGDQAPREWSVDVARGGRWSTATRRAGKGGAVQWLRAIVDYRSVSPCHIVGIGNGENDRSLLEAADERYAVRDLQGAVHHALRDVADVIVPDARGTGGFLEMLDRVANSQSQRCTQEAR